MNRHSLASPSGTRGCSLDAPVLSPEPWAGTTLRRRLVGAQGTLSGAWDPPPGLIRDHGHDRPTTPNCHWQFEDGSSVSEPPGAKLSRGCECSTNPRKVPDTVGRPQAPPPTLGSPPHPMKSQSLPEGPGFEPREVTSPWRTPPRWAEGISSQSGTQSSSLMLRMPCLEGPHRIGSSFGDAQGFR